MARILLVEDDPMLQFLVTKILEQDSHEIKVASHGSEVANLLSEFGPELVLLDIMLPDISGFSILHQIRLLYNLIELPVVMLSAKSAREDMLFSLAQGANDYLLKPANHQELKARIAVQLQIRQLAKAALAPKIRVEPL